MARLSGLDAVGRGCANLRANRELLLAQFVAMVLLVGLVVLGLVPFVGLLGLELRDFAGLDQEQSAERLKAWIEKLPALFTGERASSWLLALAAFLVALTAASILYSWFQAGTYGILAAGERQAPPGPGRRFELYRTWSRADFFGWANRWVWRYFWLYNLFGLLFLGTVAIFLLLLIVALVAAQQYGPAAAFGLGCGFSLPLLFVCFTLALACALAAAELARSDGSVLRAARRGYQLLGRRLGAAVLVYLLFLVAVMVVGAFDATSGLFVRFGLGSFPLAQLAVRFVLGLVQWLANTIVSLAFVGALVALVRSEAP